MTDVVAPETPHYVPAPETQADGELTELNTRGFVQPNLSINCSGLCRPSYHRPI